MTHARETDAGLSRNEQTGRDRQPSRVLPGVDQLDLPPRAFACDGEFFWVRRYKEGTLDSETKFIVENGRWYRTPIKHGRKKGGIRVRVQYPPSPVRTADLFEVEADRAGEVTEWLDRWLRRI
jgi:hypothetical protein